MHLHSNLPIHGQTILIIGNRSYKNLGDELILLGTVKLLLQQQKTIIISCYDPQWLQKFFSSFIDTTPITFIHELPKGFRSAFHWLKKGGLKELKYFRTTDSILLGGGEIITEENPSAYRYRLLGMRPFLLGVILNDLVVQRGKGRIQSKPNKRSNDKKHLYIMGGIQIPKSKRNQRLLHFLLNRTTHLYLRDFQAIEEIKKFGYSQVDFFMDTSYFAYPRKTNPLKSRCSVHAVLRDKTAGFSETILGNSPHIIVNLNKNGERFLPDITKDIETYLKKGYTVYFVPVAKGHNTYYNDLQYLSLINEKLNDKKAEGEPPITLQLLGREHDFDHFLHIIKNAELVISTRLHLFLIASFLGVPTKVYPYQRKILKMQEVIKKLSNERGKN